MNRITAARLSAASLLVFACALFALPARWPGYSHVQHPVALPGAVGVPGAWLFDAMVFVLPGALILLVAWRLRAAVANAGWWPRIGAALLALSALAFIAQGLLPLDPDDLDGGGSRLHASAWTVWLIAFSVGAPAFVWARRGTRSASLAIAWLVPLFALFGGAFLPEGIAQRLAFVAWFAWFWFSATRSLDREAA